MCFRRNKRQPIPPIAKLKVSDAHRVLPKEMPFPYFITGWGILHRKLFLVTTTHNIL